MPKVYTRRRWGTKPPAHSNPVYVGRPTVWGNPFKVEDHGQEGAVEKFREWIYKPQQQWLRRKIKEELRGHDLICWCAPEPCHADIIMEIANS